MHRNHGRHRENDERDEHRFGSGAYRNSEQRYDRSGYGGGGYDGPPDRSGYMPADYRSFDNHGNYGRGDFRQYDERRTFNPNENDRYGRSGPDRGIGGSYDDHHGYARDRDGRDDRSFNDRHGGYPEQQRPQQSYGRCEHCGAEMRRGRY